MVKCLSKVTETGVTELRPKPISDYMLAPHMKRVEHKTKFLFSENRLYILTKSSKSREKMQSVFHLLKQ